LEACLGCYVQNESSLEACLGCYVAFLEMWCPVSPHDDLGRHECCFEGRFQGSGVFTEYAGIATDNQLTRESVVHGALEAGNPSPHFMNIRVCNGFCRLDYYY